MTQRQKPEARDEVRTAVRFPLKLALQLKTEDGVVEATTRDISSNGLLFESNFMPQVGSRIEFTMEMPSEVMGWTTTFRFNAQDVSSAINAPIRKRWWPL